MAEYRESVTEARSVRPHPVLVLSSSSISTAGYSAAAGVLGNFVPLNESALDLSISFDENNPGLYRDSIGHYKITSSGGIEAADSSYARVGSGAALFGNNRPLVVTPDSRNALFSGGNRLNDFTIEFWLYPLNMENGEQILSWSSVRPSSSGGNFSLQRINCTASRNRLQWSFVNFFTSVAGVSSINIEFSGNAPVVPKTWSHHLVRFDAATGMVEYLVNGISEAIVYATPRGREGGEVYTPIAGSNGSFSLGERFSGLMDDFKIHNVCAGRSSIQKYAISGGRAETRAIDLGHSNSGIIRVDASGGRVSISGNDAKNEFRENGRFRFSDDAEMNFFIRSSENPYLLANSQWISFTPGINIAGIQSRYVQIAVDFYPSADGETSPYLNELRIVYVPGEPPLPPGNVTAVAVDGGVLLRWRHSPDANVKGYLVYYSTVRGELFGDGALLGSSPINVGYKNSLLIDGLKNGSLYYFRIAAYDHESGTIFNAGDFSNEVTARPLSGLPLLGLYPQGLEAASTNGANRFR
ncbi:MAG: fibronectin type III domain-containing protein [Treponema sp.]|nr:fibronectin type III domain-containing protein [Treponema sp.]